MLLGNAEAMQSFSSTRLSYCSSTCSRALILHWLPLARLVLAQDLRHMQHGSTLVQKETKHRHLQDCAAALDGKLVALEQVRGTKSTRQQMGPSCSMFSDDNVRCTFLPRLPISPFKRAVQFILHTYLAVMQEAERYRAQAERYREAIKEMDAEIEHLQAECNKQNQVRWYILPLVGHKSSLVLDDLTRCGCVLSALATSGNLELPAAFCSTCAYPRLRIGASALPLVPVGIAYAVDPSE